MTGLDRLISIYNSAETGSMTKNVVSNILRNLKQIDRMNIYDLADACYVSPASISRIVKKLGYKNYSYFQKDISDCVHKYEHHNRIVPVDKIKEENIADSFFSILENMLENIKQSLDKDAMTELAVAIHESRKIVLYAFEVSFAENFLQSDLFMSGKECAVYRNVQDMLNCAQELTENDLVIMVAPKQIEGISVKEILEKVKEKSAKVCLFTDSRHFNALKKADYQFSFDGEMRSIDAFGLQSFLCILTMEYRRLYIDSE